MRHSKTQPLKDILHQYIEAMKFTSKLRETSLIMNWEKVVGRSVAKATTKIFIHDGKLFVYVNSSIVRHELLMIKDSLIHRLNQDAGTNIISEIVIQ